MDSKRFASRNIDERRDFSRIESDWTDRLPLFVVDFTSVESYYGGSPPEAIESEEAAVTWGDLLPYADEAPRALSPNDVQFLISDFISILESGEAKYVRGDDNTWTIGLAEDVYGPSSSTLQFLQEHNFEATTENRSLEWTIEMIVDPEEIDAPDRYLERNEFLDWMRER